MGNALYPLTTINMSGETKQLIERLAKDLIHLAPLPDITPLQKEVNRLYLKLRICGMPAEEVSIRIEGLLQKHGVTKTELLK